MNPIFIGEWLTEPISYPMMIHGQCAFMMWALGDLQQVRFTAQLTINGVEYPEMTTDRQDLNLSQPTLFISDIVNLTTAEALELNTSDTIGFSLSLDHNDLQYYRPIPPPGQGKNVTLVFGGSFGSFVQFRTNSMQVTDIQGEDDPNSLNWLVSANIKCSFGTEDFNYATAYTDYEYGNKFTKKKEIIVDESTVYMEWEWNYSVTEGGSYPVTVKAVDNNYKYWALTEDVHITTPDTQVDFSIEKKDISFSNDPEKDKNTTITAKILGSGLRWKSYQVDVEFYDGSELIDTVQVRVSLGKKKEASVLWVPASDGDHDITVIVDSDDDIHETNENNNEATTSVDVKAGEGSNGTPGFDALFVLVAFSIAVIAGILTRKKRADK
jgi:hypothetical protein